jgi:hypothetical protein
MNTSETLENNLILEDLVDVIDELEEKGQYSWVDIKTKDGCKFRITVSQNALTVKNLYEDLPEKAECHEPKSFSAPRATVIYSLPQYVSVIGRSKDDGKSKFVKDKYSSRRKNK